MNFNNYESKGNKARQDSERKNHRRVSDIESMKQTLIENLDVVLSLKTVGNCKCNDIEIHQTYFFCCY